jgi:hypothetical protein
MKSILAFAFATVVVTSAYGQSFYTPAVTQKPRAGEYATRWHYGRITFKVISYTEGADTERKRVEWYNALFEKAFGSNQPGGTFAITLDLCKSDSCVKPIAKKLIAAFKKAPNEPVKQTDFLTVVGTALASIFTGGTEETTVSGATVEQAILVNGDDLIKNHLIGQPSDNNFVVRLTIASLDRVYVEKGILPELFTILNTTANDPIAKAALEAVPIASSIPVFTQAATSMAEKLMAQPAYARSITNDQPIQFINPEPYPRFIQYNLPAKSNSANDCGRSANQRKNCIILQIDASTSRSVLGVFDISAGKFASTDSRGFRATATALLGKDVDEYVASGSESLKKFITTTSVGPYKETNAGGMCGAMLDMLYKVFTRWDAKALYWAYLDLNWDKLKENASASGCLLSATANQEMTTIGLTLPTMPPRT